MNNQKIISTHRTIRIYAAKISDWLIRLVRYLIALRRSAKSYDSDMGGWRERLQWELGYADGELGLPCRIDAYNHPYEHGYYCAVH